MEADRKSRLVSFAVVYRRQSPNKTTASAEFGETGRGRSILATVTHGSRQRVLLALAALGPLLLLVAHSLLYSFTTDDAYIAFVYARNWVETGELAFNPGAHPVEGFSSFLWVAMLAGASALGLPMVATAGTLGVLFSVGTAILTFQLLLRWASWLAATWGAMILALSAGFACWTSGGLETALFVFLCTLALALYASVRESNSFWLGLIVALCAMARPEGLLLACVLAGHRIAGGFTSTHRRFFRATDVRCGLAFVGLWLPWFCWRAWYFGHWLPNTFYAKASGTADAHYQEKILAAGAHYLSQWLWQSGMVVALPLVAVALLPTGNDRHQRRFVQTSVLFGVGYVLYAVSVGGDFMGLHRFVMPIFVVGVISAVLGAHRVARLCRGHGWRAAAIVAAGVTSVAYGSYQVVLTSRLRPGWRDCAPGDSHCIAHHRRNHWPSDRGIDTPSYLAVYAHDRELIGRHLRTCLHSGDFSIFGGVGAKPFYSRGRGVDVFGLVSAEIAHGVALTRPRPGHNKWAPDDKLFQWYQPDFVFHCYSLHTAPDKPRFNCNPSFWRRRHYRRVTVHIPGLLERGSYYSFWVAADRYRQFVDECPGVVR